VVRAAFRDAIFIRPAVLFGPDDAFLTIMLELLRRLPIYPIFGRGMTRLQPAYVEDVAEAIGRVMQRAETPSMIFEFGGPRVYSYEEILREVAHQAGVAPLLIPIPFAVWHVLAWASEMFPSPLLTRNQVELMQIDTVSSPEMPGFVELGISPHSVEVILQNMLSNCGSKTLRG
jgi:NADH dehydrogenase